MVRPNFIICVRILSIISLPCFTVVYPNSWLYVQRKDFLQHGLLICWRPWICCKNCCKSQKSATIPSSLVYRFSTCWWISFHPICRLTMPVGTHWYQPTTLLCRPFSWQPQPEKGGEGVQSRMKRKQPSRTSCESTMSTSCAFPHSLFKYSNYPLRGILTILTWRNLVILPKWLIITNFLVRQTFFLISAETPVYHCCFKLERKSELW